jgi:cellulose synthase/poly-beta-1,6-N-acetylglucosamine synthase-like glycosyltransferase
MEALNTVLTILFWIGAFIVFYTYIGYGLLLYVLVRLKELRVKRQKFVPEVEFPEVTLVIAAYNEELVVAEKMINCNQLAYPKGKLHFLWITDGSSDRTNELLKAYPEVEVAFSPERRGKTAALNRGLPFVKTPLVVFTDANTYLNDQAIFEIVRAFDDPKVGCVAGEKRIRQEATGSATAGEGIYWKYESTLKTLDDRLYSAVGAAGELFAIRTSLFQELPNDTLLDDFIMSMNIAADGYRIAYCKAAYAEETPSYDMKEEGKRKVRISAGGMQSILRLKKLLNPFKYGTLCFQYVSHRVLRWSVTPICLFLLLPLNIALLFTQDFSLLYLALLLLQVMFYVSGIAGSILANKQIRNKFLYVPYYFLFMNVNVVKGFRYLSKNKGTGVWAKAKRG